MLKADNSSAEQKIREIFLSLMLIEGIGPKDVPISEQEVVLYSRLKKNLDSGKFPASQLLSFSERLCGA